MPDSKQRQRPEPNNTPSVVEADAVYSLKEVARRLRWKEHSVRQAKRLGLQIIKFGSRHYVTGREVMRFFEALADRANETNP